MVSSCGRSSSPLLLHLVGPSRKSFCYFLLLVCDSLIHIMSAEEVVTQQRQQQKYEDDGSRGSWMPLIVVLVLLLFRWLAYGTSTIPVRFRRFYNMRVRNIIRCETMIHYPRGVVIHHRTCEGSLFIYLFFLLSFLIRLDVLVSCEHLMSLFLFLFLRGRSLTV